MLKSLPESRFETFMRKLRRFMSYVRTKKAEKELFMETVRLENLYLASAQAAGILSAVNEETRYSTTKQEAPIVEIMDDPVLNERLNKPGVDKFNTIRDYIFEQFDGNVFNMSDGRTVIVDRRDAHKLAHSTNNKRNEKFIGSIKKLVEKATYNHSAYNVTHNKFKDFHYYVVVAEYNGDRFPLWVNVGTTKNDKTDHIYDITEKAPAEIVGVGAARQGEYRAPNAFSSDSITQSEQKSNTFSDKSSEKDETRYSLGEAPAEAYGRQDKVFAYEDEKQAI